MGFDVAADAYGRFMGRYSAPLTGELLRLVDPQPGQRALDVGCGPGVVAAALVERLGAASVCAIDPSAPFVPAARQRLPGVDVRNGGAEQLPWPDASFDRAVAQLVVHFMADPVAGLREMARVTRPDGLVAASVWDYGGNRSPLSTFWQVVRETDPEHPGEAALAGAREGHLAQLFAAAGLADVQAGEMTVRVPMAGFDDWWEPFLLGVGPAGQYLAAATRARREQLRQRCAECLPAGPFEVEATAWVTTGRPASGRPASGGRAAAS
ncbi:MAG TPA: methyltransferase domain-containing protein [Jatrophihabitans sp.]|nr:methyltransferase domain-containing protein [Jatrophihabitans sp.]